MQNNNNREAKVAKAGFTNAKVRFPVTQKRLRGIYF
jgi:hypothetical protein